MDVQRRPGEGRYAHVEREQRWLLPRLPAGLAAPTSIVDMYLNGTRLRLRRASTGGEVVYKLGQKVRPDPGSPELVKLTNMYLSAHEYAVLRRLPGDELRKTRRRATGLARLVVVDEFHDRFAGLVLAEVELAPAESRFDPPWPDAVDVTDDDRFAGGYLASLADRDVPGLLGAAGATPPGEWPSA